MTAARRRLSHILGRIGRLAAQDGGMAAVEFSLILPILVLLWLGGVEVTQALSIDRRLNNLASSIGDLTARSKTLTWGDVDKIFDIAPGAMFPYAQSVQMRVSAVNMDGSGNAKVAWSRAKSTTAYAVNTTVNGLVPASLRVPDTQIIMSEVVSSYTPTVGYVISGSIQLDDRMFFVPRLVNNVKLCDNAGNNCKS